MVEARLTSSGTLKIKAPPGEPVKVWGVEVEFLCDVERAEGREGEKRVATRVRDTIRVNRLLAPGEELSVELGIPASRVERVVVYYFSRGSFCKKEAERSR